MGAKALDVTLPVMPKMFFLQEFGNQRYQFRSELDQVPPFDEVAHKPVGGGIRQPSALKSHGNNRGIVYCTLLSLAPQN